jgi:peptidoglycan hydrolase-like protein with peptidoglycan-binding domain
MGRASISGITAVVAAGLMCSADVCATTTPKKNPTPAKKPTTTAHKTPVHTAHTAPSKRGVTKKSPARAAWHPGQTAPTPDRYKEIQEALAKKGYLHGDATGVWNADSADALRRFQQDQNLSASGKLDSLSLIALGLGPKY